MRLEDTHIDDIPNIIDLEQDDDAKLYIIPYSRARHQEELQKDRIVYKNILTADDAFAGFIILNLEDDRASVELRRIVIGNKGQGYGQLAMKLIEEFCFVILGRQRIWLDVFEHNSRGIHLYEKLGYQKIGESMFQDKKLWLYEKSG